jgi:glycosyltransferase involved in cell wall biosynthesis
VIRKKINHTKLSIIIPVFNVEPYVEKCLRSCAEQNIPLSEYEIIVVNDGTKDNSLAIAEQVSKEYSNIFVVSQENLGLSAARNKGLSLATGEYVWFIDSDDWIEDNCLRIIVDSLHKNCPDGLVICGANIINGIPIKRQDYSMLKRTIYSGIELLKMDFWEPCVQFVIYARSFLRENKLKFKEGVFHEDSEFTPRSFYFAKRLAILNNVIYLKFENPNSITGSVNHKKAFDIIKVARSLSAFTQIVPKDLKYLFNNKISLSINDSLYLSYQMDKVTIRNINLEWEQNKFLFSHLRKSSIAKYRLEGILFWIFPRNYVQIYKLLQLMNKKIYK